MELKLIALTLFVLILIYFNYRRYKRLERQRALLHQARNGLIFESSTSGPFRRSINITTRNPHHQIAIIFPGSDLNYRTETNNNTGINPSHDLPPSYYDLFSESELKGAGDSAATCTGVTHSSGTGAGGVGNVLPTYGQIMSDSSNPSPASSVPATVVDSSNININIPNSCGPPGTGPTPTGASTATAPAGQTSQERY